MSQKISLAISPCPNDTFIFGELLQSRADDFQFFLHDIEQLNQGAISMRWDVVKVSCAIAHQLENNYQMLASGGAMGIGVGPLLVASSPNIPLQSISKVAIPGLHTTAYKLFRFAFPSLDCQWIEMNFADIEDAVCKGKVDAGVIIHESRFTYKEKNLHCLADLGNIWESKTLLPVPLGCIMIKKKLYPTLGNTLEKDIQKSLQHAWQAYPDLSDFVRHHAQTMQEDVMRSHIQLYVNSFTMDMGNDGRNAIQMLNSC